PRRFAPAAHSRRPIARIFSNSLRARSSHSPRVAFDASELQSSGSPSTSFSAARLNASVLSCATARLPRLPFDRSEPSTRLTPPRLRRNGRNPQRPQFERIRFGFRADSRDRAGEIAFGSSESGILYGENWQW